METCGTCARIRRKLRKLMPKVQPVVIDYEKNKQQQESAVLMNLAIDTISRQLYDVPQSRQTLDLLESHIAAWSRQIATQRLEMPKQVYRKETTDA